jgi:hypothetical protein
LGWKGRRSTHIICSKRMVLSVIQNVIVWFGSLFEIRVQGPNLGSPCPHPNTKGCLRVSANRKVFNPLSVNLRGPGIFCTSFLYTFNFSINNASL